LPSGENRPVVSLNSPRENSMALRASGSDPVSGKTFPHNTLTVVGCQSPDLRKPQLAVVRQFLRLFRFPQLRLGWPRPPAQEMAVMLERVEAEQSGRHHGYPGEAQPASRFQ